MKMRYDTLVGRPTRRCAFGPAGMSTYFAAFLAFLLHVSAGVAQDDDPLPGSAATFQPQYDPALDRGAYGAYPVREYYSVDTKVPILNYLNWTSECASENTFYFITPKGWKVPNPGPMVLDYRGDLVWAQRFENEFGGQAYDLMVQEYLGEKFLTFWLGDDRIRGHGAGHFHMVSTSNAGSFQRSLLVQSNIKIAPYSLLALHFD